jgi:hypothetical protein
MAVHPPTGPFPPNDGSNIFRRGLPKPTVKPIPPSDDQVPPEPAEVLDLDDEDALFATPGPARPIDDLDAALSGVMLNDPADDDAPVSAILLDDGPDASGAEPLSAELLDDALGDSRPPVPPSAADSSIFSGGLAAAAGVGSGWLDEQEPTPGSAPTSGDVWSGPLPDDLPPPADPPSTAKYADAADLFADLRGDTPASDSVWLEADGDAPEDTGRVSESEVRRVLDTTRPDFDDDPAARSSLAEIDLDDGPAGGLLAGDGEDVIEATDVDSSLSDAAAGSSIFDRLEPADTELMDDADDIDFNLPVPTEPSHASSMSGRLVNPEVDPEAVANDLFGEATLDAADADAGGSVGIPLDGTDDRSPAIAAAVAAGALGGVGAGSGRSKAEPRDKEAWKDDEKGKGKGKEKEKGKEKAKSSAKVSPPARRIQPIVTTDADDRPAPPAKKKGGLGGVLAGLATGLALGAGGFGLLYVTGMIPNEKKGPVVANVPTPAAGDAQLAADLAAANEKADKAAEDLKQAKEGLAKRQIALDEASEQLRTAQDELTTAKKEATAAKKEAVDALAMIDPLKKDAETAKKEATEAKKLAADADGLKKDLEAAKKLATDAAKERDDAKTALDTAKTALETAKKDATDAIKTAADADTKYNVAATKLKMTEDTITGLVKELKANKLLDDKDDAAKLPEAIKKLAAVATSGDAQKAAEALVTAQKERDAAKAALATAETEAKAATAAAVKAKTEADKLVADATKAADDKARTAVEEATKGLKKQLDDATAAAKKAQADLTIAKATGKAEAEAAAKGQLDAANARAVAAEKALDTKVKALEAEYAAKLADARSGVVKVVPAEMEANEKATRSYADGMAAYRGGRYADAETAFAAATASHPADARFWYFLGLARTQTGAAGADEAFKKGAEMEGRNKPSGKMIDAALERLSYGDKQRVNKYRQ